MRKVPPEIVNLACLGCGAEGLLGERTRTVIALRHFDRGLLQLGLHRTALALGELRMLVSVVIPTLNRLVVLYFKSSGLPGRSARRHGRAYDRSSPSVPIAAFVLVPSALARPGRERTQRFLNSSIGIPERLSQSVGRPSFFGLLAHAAGVSAPGANYITHRFSPRSA